MPIPTDVVAIVYDLILDQVKYKVIVHSLRLYILVYSL